MKRFPGIFLTCVICATVVAPAWADPSWATGFPRSGKKAGEITVKGTFDCPAEGTVRGTIAVWLPGVERFQSFPLEVSRDCGSLTWSGTATGLQSGATYVVIVSITIVEKDGTMSSHSPDPETAVAK